MPVASGTWFAAQWLFMLIVYGGDCSSVLLLGLQLSAVVVHYIVPRHVGLCPLWNRGMWGKHS